MRPVPGSQADQRDHPHSIFTALARRGYRTVSSEEATRDLPAEAVPWRPRAAAGDPSAPGRRARGSASTASCASLRRGERPTLWVKHLLLPHGPYLYLPSGARTREGVRDLVPGMNGLPGFRDPFLTRHNEQRYLLQLGFVDRLIGRLLRRLKGQGMYDNTLIVVTADHGHLLAARGGDPPVRERLERRGGHARAADRQGARPAPGAGERCARAHPRRDSHDRRRARRAARLPDRRGVGVRAGGAPAADGEPRHARLQLGGAHLGTALGGAPAQGDRPQAAPIRLRRARACTPASVPTAN